MPTMDKAHALVIGIANYEQLNKLPPTVTKDATDIHDRLIDPEHCGYSKDSVELLLDGEATVTAIRDGLANLARRSDDTSTALFYISSHGGRIESGPFAGEYLLPVNTEYTSAESVAQTAISGAEFTELLRAIPARKMVIIFDCCHSGGIGQPKDAVAPEIKTLPESYYAQLEEGRGRVILASSRSTESSYILPGEENSLFTKHLLAGLQGAVPGPGGVIRIFDLFHHVAKQVQADHSHQHPVCKAEVEENFPIALYLGGKAPAPIPASPLDDGYAYDVFINYSGQKRDRSWVRKALLPWLEQERLRYTVDFHFRLGVPKIKAREMAIQDSRYTLLVLSQAYLDAGYAEFTDLVAQHLGIEEGRSRVLPVLMEDCTPRAGLEMLELLDLSDEDELEWNIERLIYQLRQPPVQV